MGEIIARVAISVIVTLLLGLGIRMLVIALVRRSADQSPCKATLPGVIFVVSSPGWRSTLLAGVGLLFVATGCALVALAVLIGGSSAGAGPGGVLIGLAGGVFVALARGLSQRRLEATRNSIWVFRAGRSPQEISVGEITRLTPLITNRYGGVVVHAGRKRLFSVNRLMLGYGQLLDYLLTSCPDLKVPEKSRPLRT